MLPNANVKTEYVLPLCKVSKTNLRKGLASNLYQTYLSLTSTRVKAGWPSNAKL